MQSAIKLGAWMLLALATAASPVSARGGGHGRAHGNHHGNHHDRGWHDNGRYGRDRHDDGGDRRWDDQRAASYSDSQPIYRGPSYRYYGPARYDIRRVAVPRWNGPGYGAGYYAPAPRWTRGVRYYDHGYGPTYVITDYPAYGLRYPPHGYGWRRDDRGDFLLVWLATGVIVDLIVHGGY